MAEKTQSRYGIMEELNQQKLKAKEELSTLVEEMTEEEMKHVELIQKYGNNIAESDATFKQNHENWKTNRKMEINIIKKRTEREVTAIEEDIKEKDENYEKEHDEYIYIVQHTIKKTTKDYDKNTKLNKLQKNAIEDKIEELDKAILSLKEISSDQSKANK